MALLINQIDRLDIGIQGETGAREISIDCSAWMQSYPGGTVSILHMRNGETPVGVTGSSFDADTGILTWTPNDYDTANAGVGAAVIRLTEGNVIKKSRDIQVIVHPSVTNEAGESISSNWQAYINEVERLKNLANTSKEAAKDSAEAAETSANAAAGSAGDAETLAVGTRGGIPVDQDDPAYQNNAKYWAGQAHDSADAAEEYAKAAGEAADAAADSEANAKKSEDAASHWAELALLGADRHAWLFTSFDEETGLMTIAASDSLGNDLQFIPDYDRGVLEVYAND